MSRALNRAGVVGGQEGRDGAKHCRPASPSSLARSSLIVTDDRFQRRAVVVAVRRALLEDDRAAGSCEGKELRIG